MAGFTAKDVQALRKATGAGMLDAKKALEETDGDTEKAATWLREQGLAGAAKRSGRDASEGAVSVVRDGNAAAIVLLRSETDFVAKAAEFVSIVDELAARVATDGVEAVETLSSEIDTMRTTLKENISVGEVVRLEATEGQVIDTYLHQQAGRGVNAVAVVLSGGDQELAHDIAVHIAFAKPQVIRRDEIPADEVAAERATIESISRNEGKPDAALPKIVEGRLNGWFKERVLLEQPYARDEKQTISQLLNGAEIVAYAQVLVG
jgi:elongation factor Ts